MKNLKFSRLFAAVTFVAILALAGCKQQVEEKLFEVSMYGTWADDFEDYNAYTDYDCKITVDYIETASYGKHTGSVYITRTSEDSGYIYYQFSENVTGYDAEFNPYTVNSKGKWSAIAFKNLTKDSVQMCDVYDATYAFPATLEECISKYTIDGGYFAGINTTFVKK